MGRVRLDFNHSQLNRIRRNVRTLPDRINLDVAAIVDFNAAWGQAWMRLNAPWTDDTGAARGGLLAIPQHFGRLHEIFLTYSVYYGIWLEVANSGKYQVLQPALRIVGKKLMDDIEGMLNK